MPDRDPVGRDAAEPDPPAELDAEVKGNRGLSHLFILVAGILCAPAIGAALNQMIFRGWFGLDEIYAAHPTLTLAIAALLSVVPLGVTMNYYLDDP